ncbi:uncharacterized protein K444DRAFT_408041 [Hyaloscypha bicolor E]|uniref:Uncharacterized protein n=1 Tax=Hyaloscypha bicolor E TaxID=1095630 RepID=A0A2J6T9M0_9HELO|nr:uncharacterized protein K444DRAFT_408041 [Hyaloscypha bicolor E]PMD59698.1 hypothetical protein K444DRAFT_408041 [Hyaloscypha bicolor E]
MALKKRFVSCCFVLIRPATYAYPNPHDHLLLFRLRALQLHSSIAQRSGFDRGGRRVVKSYHCAWNSMDQPLQTRGNFLIRSN